MSFWVHVNWVSLNTNRNAKSYRGIYEVDGERIVITLPSHLLSRRKVLVTIDEVGKNRDEKLNKMSKAATDPLFQEDINSL